MSGIFVMEFKTKKKTFWERLSDHSVSKITDQGFTQSYSQLYQEWKYFGYLSDSLQEFIDVLKSKGYTMVNDDPEHCVCGTPIRHKYVIINPITLKYAIIGSCCREKFFAPKPSGKKSALAYILHDLRCKLEILQHVKNERLKSEIERLLDVTIYYIEKQTKFKKYLIVTKNFAEKVKEFTGVEWKWETWDDYIG